MKRLLATGLLGLAALPAAAEDAALQRLPLLQETAPLAVQVSPRVPGMGEHWAEPDRLPGGPIYCVIEGRIVCVEYMFEAEALAEGTNWLALAPGIETPPISHIDLEFKPQGIEPHPVPLYQLHIYFADRDLLERH